MANVVAGAAISFGISALSRALTPTQYVYNKQENGKIDNLNVRKTGLGWALNRYYGKDIVNGCQIFWAIPKVDRPETTTNRQRSGGKGGGGTVTTTETTEHKYYGTFAIAVGDGPVSSIRKIIFNDEIWYNQDGNTTGNAANNAYVLANHLEIYLGTGNQSVSPTISTYDDPDRCHFPYLVYLVIKDLPLASFGNELPSTIDVVVQGTETTLEDVIIDACSQVKLPVNTAIIASNLSDVNVIGATLKQDGSSVKSFIDELLQLNFAQSYLDDNGILNFVKQLNGDAAINVDYEDLGATTYGSNSVEPFSETIVNADTLPSVVSFDFKNINDNYSSYSSEYIKNSVSHVKPEAISSNLALTPELGGQFCYRYLNLLWGQRNRFSIALLPEKALLLNVGEKISFPLVTGGDVLTFQVTELQIGADLMGEVSLIPYDGQLFSANPSIRRGSTVTYSGAVIQLIPNITTPPIIYNGATLLVESTDYTVNYTTGQVTPITVATSTELVIDYTSAPTGVVNDYNPSAEIASYGQPVTTILDINRVNSGDPPCLYLAIKPDPTLGESFGDTTIYSRLNGGSYSQVGTAIAATTIGTLSGSLPSATGLDITNTFTVVLSRGSLDNLTTDEFTNNDQIILIDSEQIVVRDAVLTAPLTYSCDHLKRGHNGTIPASHSSSAIVTVLKGDGQVIRLNGDSSLIGKVIDIKAVPVGSSIDNITTVSSLTVVGNYFKPYAGSSASATKNQGNDVTINWTANHTGLLALSPLSFAVDIMNGVTVVRTLSSVVSSVSYTAAQQITDFGSIQSSYTVKIYQLSLEYGRGYVYQATITPTLTSIIPTITAFSPTQGAITNAITIYGTGFTGATNAKINTISITSFSVVNDTTITGIVAATTTTGKVTVTNASGTGTSLTDFVIVTEIKEVIELATLASFPATGATGRIYIALDTNKTYRWDVSSYVEIGKTTAWGAITGTLSSQSDLNGILSRIRRYTTTVGSFTVPVVNSTVNVTVLDPQGLDINLPVAVGDGSGPYAQLLVTGISGNIVTLRRDSIAANTLVSQTVASGAFVTQAYSAESLYGIVQSAISINGISVAGNNKYYGTNNAGIPGIYDLSIKQDTLTSGTNIKSIQSSSLLGSGNIGINTFGSIFIATPTTTTITLFTAPYATTINLLRALRTTAGTCTVSIQKNGVNVTGLGSISVTSTPQNPTATALNTLVAGDIVTLVIASPVSAANLSFTMGATLT